MSGMNFKKAYNEYDLNQDFVEVKDLFLEEVLSDEDVEDGLTPETIHYKVGITSHAYDRMYNTEDRDCEWEAVETLIREKAESLSNVKSGEEFALLNEDKTFAIVCEINYQDGLIIMRIITVIRKVIANVPKKVFISRQTKII